MTDLVTVGSFGRGLIVAIDRRAAGNNPAAREVVGIPLGVKRCTRGTQATGACWARIGRLCRGQNYRPERRQGAFLDFVAHRIHGLPSSTRDTPGRVRTRCPGATRPRGSRRSGGTNRASTGGTVYLASTRTQEQDNRHHEVFHASSVGVGCQGRKLNCRSGRSPLDCASALRPHVVHVVLVSAKEKVVWSHALTIVAVVANEQTISATATATGWDRTVGQYPGRAMRRRAASPKAESASPDRAIAIDSKRSDPRPAFAQGRVLRSVLLINETPESDRHWLGTVHPNRMQSAATLALPVVNNAKATGDVLTRASFKRTEANRWPPAFRQESLAIQHHCNITHKTHLFSIPSVRSR